MRQINIEIFIYVLIEISIVVVVKKIRQYGARKIFVNYVKINLNGRKYKNRCILSFTNITFHNKIRIIDSLDFLTYI